METIGRVRISDQEPPTPPLTGTEFYDPWARESDAEPAMPPLRPNRERQSSAGDEPPAGPPSGPVFHELAHDEPITVLLAAEQPSVDQGESPASGADTDSADPAALSDTPQLTPSGPADSQFVDGSTDEAFTMPSVVKTPPSHDGWRPTSRAEGDAAGRIRISDVSDVTPTRSAATGVDGPSDDLPITVALAPDEATTESNAAATARTVTTAVSAPVSTPTDVSNDESEQPERPAADSPVALAQRAPIGPASPTSPSSAQRTRSPAADTSPAPSTPVPEPRFQPLEETEATSDLGFLRREMILLDPGEFQFDVTFQYLNDTTRTPTLVIQGQNGRIGDLRNRQRLWTVPLEMRVGVSPFVQAFVNLPVGWSSTEQTLFGLETSPDHGGLGDLRAGVTRQLAIGTGYYPDILGTIELTAPTGNSSFETALAKPGSVLGAGYWAVSGELTFIQAFQPLVLFYGGGFRHRFENKFGHDLKVDPGEELFYRSGVGVAMTPRVTFSAALTGSLITEPEVNDVELDGRLMHPLAIRLAATISRRQPEEGHPRATYIEPFVKFGLNSDANDVLFGISWTH